MVAACFHKNFITIIQSFKLTIIKKIKINAAIKDIKDSKIKYSIFLLFYLDLDFI